MTDSKALKPQRLRFPRVSGVARQRLSSRYRAGPALVGPVENREGPGQGAAHRGGRDGTCSIS